MSSNSLETQATKLIQVKSKRESNALLLQKNVYLNIISQLSLEDAPQRQLTYKSYQSDGLRIIYFS